MKTFQEFYDYIQTLSPMSETDTRFSAHAIPNTTVGIAVYSGYTQANIINTETGIAIVDIFFRPEENEVDCFKVDRKGYADYDHPYHVPMSAAIEGFMEEMIANLGRYAANIVKGVFERAKNSKTNKHSKGGNKQ